MIKINVIVKDKNWFKYIKNPEAYLSRKIKKIQTDKFFGKKKISIQPSFIGSKRNKISK